MDVTQATTFCESQLKSRFNPPGILLEDLVQEYILAELSGDDPRKHVSRLLKQSLKESRKTEDSPKMQLYPSRAAKVGESDEEVAEYEELEAEIAAEQQAKLWQEIDAAMAKLTTMTDSYVAEEVAAMRLFFGLDGKPLEYRQIAGRLGCTEAQAENLVGLALEKIRAIVSPKETELPMFGIKDAVYSLRRAYRRSKGHFKRKEMDMFAA